MGPCFPKDRAGWSTHGPSNSVLLMENSSHLSLPPVLLMMEVGLALLQSPPPAPSAFPCPGASPCCSPTTLPKTTPQSWWSSSCFLAFWWASPPSAAITMLPNLPSASSHPSPGPGLLHLSHSALQRPFSAPCTTSPGSSLLCLFPRKEQFPKEGNPKPVAWDPSNFNWLADRICPWEVTYKPSWASTHAKPHFAHTADYGYNHVLGFAQALVHK